MIESNYCALFKKDFLLNITGVQSTLFVNSYQEAFACLRLWLCLDNCVAKKLMYSANLYT